MAELRADVKAWLCPYCGHLIDVSRDRFHDAVDHMLDSHRAELIADRPKILHGPQERK
jgi:hypothetical protein